MQVGGRRPLARARAGAGVGPVGGTFLLRNVHFHKVFKGNYLQLLVEDNLFVFLAFLMIFTDPCVELVQCFPDDPG